MLARRHVHIPAWDLKDNIRSVILDWRREPLVTQANLSAPPCVFSGHCSTSLNPFPDAGYVLLAINIKCFMYKFNCLLFICWRLRHPHWRNADGAEGIFGFCWMRVGCGPASGPTLKRPCAILVQCWDGK